MQDKFKYFKIVGQLWLAGLSVRHFPFALAGEGETRDGDKQIATDLIGNEPIRMKIHLT